MIEDFSGLITNGLYCLINERDKKVALWHTSSLLESIAKHLTQLQRGICPIRPLQTEVTKNKFLNLELKVLETGVEGGMGLALKHGTWCKSFEDLGYELYNPRKPLTLKPRIICNPGTGISKVEVVLTNKAYKSITVGIFRTILEAKQFLETFYQEGFTKIVYADNDLSIDLRNVLKSLT